MREIGVAATDARRSSFFVTEAWSARLAFLRAGAVTLACMTLAACGGGGSGGLTANPPTSPAASYIVTTFTSSGGKVSPMQSAGRAGEVVEFQIQLDSGQTLASAAGCGGQVVGVTYRTAPLTGDCTVTFQFGPDPRVTVTSKASVGGSIAPSQLRVAKGQSAQVQLRPRPDYRVTGVSGCAGERNGNVYSIHPLHADCELQVDFAPWPGATPVLPGRTVAFVYADAAMRDQLQAFAAAVAADTGAATVLVDVPPGQKASDIQARLATVPDLWGVYLIGDLPPSRRSSDGTQPADWAYLDSSCSGVDDSVRSLCRTERWSARIPGQRTEVLAYLQRNLATRYSNQWAQKAEFVHGAWHGGQPAEDAPAAYSGVPLFPVGAVTLLDRGDAAQRRSDFATCLGKAIELCQVNVHGAPTLLQFEGPGQAGVFYSADTALWTSADASNTTVRAKWILIDSCSTGNFTVTSFLAGRLLHAGALLVEANTVDAAISSDAVAFRANREHAALARGASLAQVAQRWQSPTHFFGDPTVVMRGKPADARPRLYVDEVRMLDGKRRMDVQFADSPSGTAVGRELLLSNRGNSELILVLPLIDYGASVDGQFLIGVAQPIMLTWSTAAGAEFIRNGLSRVALGPGEQMTLKLLLSPHHRADGTVWPGLHQSALVFYSNDPDLPVLHLEGAAKVGQ